MRKNWLPIFIVIIALFAGGFYAFKTNLLGLAAGGAAPVACTMEAKLCPDGVTYVGRQGPACEFAACPPASTATSSSGDAGGAAHSNAIVLAIAHVGEKAAGLGLSVTPQEVLEDSRCPAGVYCIQAGTVRIRAQIETSHGISVQELALNKPLIINNQKIVLTAVAPLKAQGGAPEASAYAFTFEIFAPNNL